MTGNWVLFGVGGLLSLSASVLLVARLEGLADRLVLSEAMLGLLAALAGDAPEITSSLTAVAHGDHAVGVGVALGSNLFNLAALLGLGALVAGRIRLQRKVVLLDGTVVILASLLALASVIRLIPAIAGLLGVLVVLSAYLLAGRSGSRTPGESSRRRSRARSWLEEAVQEEQLELSISLSRHERRFDGPLAGLATLVVVGASVLMERGAVGLGNSYRLSNLIVGGLILAAVTSLPNAVAAIYLASRGKGSAVLSLTMNSNTLNSLVALLVPGSIAGFGMVSDKELAVVWWYLGLSALALGLAFVRRGIDRISGTIIIGAYLVLVLILAA